VAPLELDSFRPSIPRIGHELHHHVESRNQGSRAFYRQIAAEERGIPVDAHGGAGRAANTPDPGGTGGKFRLARAAERTFAGSPNDRAPSRFSIWRRNK